MEPLSQAVAMLREEIDLVKMFLKKYKLYVDFLNI